MSVRLVSNGLNVSLAMTQDFDRVSGGLPIPGIAVLRQSPNNMSQFVKHDHEPGFRSISNKRGKGQYLPSAVPHERVGRVKIPHSRRPNEESAVGVDLYSRVHTCELACLRAPWILKECFA